jgi:hypothetical protein
MPYALVPESGQSLSGSVEPPSQTAATTTVRAERTAATMSFVSAAVFCTPM